MTTISDQNRFERAIALFDAANAEDPRQDDGRPRELVYAERMTEMLERFAPEATESVRLACRAQHICRWKIPRQDYPKTPEGYQHWRTTLYKFHAETAAALMREAGYDAAAIERVQKVVGKRGLKVNPETQMMEDVVGLVFIEYYMVGFAGEHPEYTEEKWLDIIRKTWKKMSDDGRAFALSGKLRLPETLLPLIQKAVSGA
jgi:hypothetical protein